MSTHSSGHARPKRSLYQIQHFWMERSIHTQVIQILRYFSIVSMYQPSNAALTATLVTKANECLWSRAWTANTRTSTLAPLSVNLQPSSSSLALAVSRCSVGTRRATGSLPSFHSLVAREEPWVILTMKLSLQEVMSWGQDTHTLAFSTLGVVFLQWNMPWPTSLSKGLLITMLHSSREMGL